MIIVCLYQQILLQLTHSLFNKLFCSLFIFNFMEVMFYNMRNIYTHK